MYVLLSINFIVWYFCLHYYAVVQYNVKILVVYVFSVKCWGCVRSGCRITFWAPYPECSAQHESPAGISVPLCACMTKQNFRQNVITFAYRMGPYTPLSFLKGFCQRMGAGLIANRSYSMILSSFNSEPQPFSYHQFNFSRGPKRVRYRRSRNLIETHTAQ